jgi:hypothetical protein
VLVTLVSCEYHDSPTAPSRDVEPSFTFTGGSGRYSPPPIRVHESDPGSSGGRVRRPSILLVAALLASCGEVARESGETRIALGWTGRCISPSCSGPSDRTGPRDGEADGYSVGYRETEGRVRVRTGALEGWINLTNDVSFEGADTCV